MTSLGTETLLSYPFFIEKALNVQYIPRNMHTVFALLCFVVVIHWLIVPYPSGLLHWHCGNLTIAPVPAKQPWWIWINTSCEFIMNDCITTTKQSTTKQCAYFLGYTVHTCHRGGKDCWWHAGECILRQPSKGQRIAGHLVELPRWLPAVEWLPLLCIAPLRGHLVLLLQRL